MRAASTVRNILSHLVAIACLLCSLVQAPTHAHADEAAAIEQFESEVRPIIASECLKCHGGSNASGGLRLDTRSQALKGGAHGPAVVPGKPDQSLLLSAIAHSASAPAMPPGVTLTKAQVQAVRRWIVSGAPWPAKASSSGEPAGLWSLKPVTRPAVPEVTNTSWSKSPIDRFVYAHLSKQGMTPAPPATKLQLIRRVTMDLTGLPPTPGEVAEFVNDTSANSYAKLVDRLLASPHYGERWARYWLDLVRYADSNGYERDAEKTYSWKYRDWVIESLNRDKPYNRFVTEQLAGDELPDCSLSTVTATGFLRLGTWDDEPNDALLYKYDRLDDLVHATATAFLGLTVRCARCHDHKFDPISQKDYYAFAAHFYNGYLEPADSKLLGGPPENRLGFPVLGFTERPGTPPDLHLLINGDPRRESDVIKPGFLTALSSFKPAVVPPVSDGTTSLRRSQLAAWITDERNPLTARVIVNRIWQHHFGFGIVRTPNNFGRKGAPPSHPELLDWLADAFVHQDHWQFKPLHRRILLSAAYRMSSTHPKQAAYAQKDFLNEHLWRFNRQRLDADGLRDSMLAVSGDLNVKTGGPGFMPTVTPEALEGLSRKGAEWVPSAPEEQNRRTIYLFLKRALILPMLTAFDFADTTQPLEQRDVTTVAPQSLSLMNNPFAAQQATDFARRVFKTAGADYGKQVTTAWQLAYGRSPEPAEAQMAVRYLKEYRSAASIAAQTSALPSPTLVLRADTGTVVSPDGRIQAWRDPAHAGLSAGQEQEVSRPLLVPAALNGKPAVRFDGKSSFLKIAGQPVTSRQFSLVALVCDRDKTGGHREIFSNWNRDGNVGSSLFLGMTGAASARLSDDFSPVGAISSPEKPFLLTGIASDSSVAVYQNRQEIARRISPLSVRKLDGPYVIGQQGNIGGEYWNGDVYEIRVYDVALTDAQRDLIWDEMSSRYGVAARPAPVSEALQSLCHVLFNSNEFLYVD